MSNSLCTIPTRGLYDNFTNEELVILNHVLQNGLTKANDVTWHATKYGDSYQVAADAHDIAFDVEQKITERLGVSPRRLIDANNLTVR